MQQPGGERWRQTKALVMLLFALSSEEENGKTLTADKDLKSHIPLFFLGLSSNLCTTDTWFNRGEGSEREIWDQLRCQAVSTLGYGDGR